MYAKARCPYSTENGHLLFVLKIEDGQHHVEKHHPQLYRVETIMCTVYDINLGKVKGSFQFRFSCSFFLIFWGQRDGISWLSPVKKAQSVFHPFAFGRWVDDLQHVGSFKNSLPEAPDANMYIPFTDERSKQKYSLNSHYVFSIHVNCPWRKSGILHRRTFWNKQDLPKCSQCLVWEKQL